MAARRGSSASGSWINHPSKSALMVNDADVLVATSGGVSSTMPVTLPGDAATDLLAVPKQQLDDEIATRQPLDGDLSALAALAAVGIPRRTGSDAWDQIVYDKKTTFTPSWTATTTNPVIGDGSIVASFVRFDKLIMFAITITAGASTTFGDGSYRLTLPSDVDQVISAQLIAHDVSLDIRYNGAVTFLSGSTVFAVMQPNSSASGYWGHNVPVAWANGDIFRVSGFYFEP